MARTGGPGTPDRLVRMEMRLLGLVPTPRRVRRVGGEAVIGTVTGMTDSPHNPHFVSADTIEEAAELLTFRPLPPGYTAGFGLAAIRVFVRDHRMRDVPMTRRTVELHYGGFVVSQSHPGPEEARRLAVEVRYGASPVEVLVLGREGKLYELGPDARPDDTDGRMPSVVTWHDDGVHHLIASGELEASRLVEIAMSLYH